MPPKSSEPDGSATVATSYKPHPLATPRAGATNMDVLSGDHGIKGNTDLQDFIWSMSDEPHASRRKAMIKDVPAVKKLMGYEWKTKYIVAALVALHYGCAIALRDEVFSLRWWLVVYVVGATTASAIFLAIHEISHNLAFKSFFANRVLGILANCPMVVPFFIFFKNYHNEHHKYQGVEGVDTDLPTATEAKYLGSQPGKFFFMFFQTWFYAFRPMFIRYQAFTRWHLFNSVVVLAADALLVSLFGWRPMAYLLASIHLQGSIHPIASHFVAEHVTFAGELETNSYYGWMNWLTWNVGYHNEHHDFPNVPWSRLPALRKAGAKYYDQIPYHNSWVGALYRFLADPKVTFYNRVKREKTSEPEDDTKKQQ